jgi:Cu2+-containing amine oxidase
MHGCWSKWQQAARPLRPSTQPSRCLPAPPQDGTISYEIKLTGELSTNMLSPGEDAPQHGTLVAEGVNAQHHQHMFCARLDMAVDDPQGGKGLVVTEVGGRPGGLVECRWNAGWQGQRHGVWAAAASRQADMRNGRYRRHASKLVSACAA